ncbi:catalase-related domain-containing protein, partial [Herbidospora sp. RD11066]
FSQVTLFWEKVLDEAARARLVSNIAGHLKDAKEFIQNRAVENFSKVHADFGNRLTKELATYKK